MARRQHSAGAQPFNLLVLLLLLPLHPLARRLKKAGVNGPEGLEPVTAETKLLDYQQSFKDMGVFANWMDGAFLHVVGRTENQTGVKLAEDWIIFGSHQGHKGEDTQLVFIVGTPKGALYLESMHSEQISLQSLPTEPGHPDDFGDFMLQLYPTRWVPFAESRTYQVEDKHGMLDLKLFGKTSLSVGQVTVDPHASAILKRYAERISIGDRLVGVSLSVSQSVTLRTSKLMPCLGDVRVPIWPTFYETSDVAIMKSRIQTKGTSRTFEFVHTPSPPSPKTWESDRNEIEHILSELLGMPCCGAFYVVNFREYLANFRRRVAKEAQGEELPDVDWTGAFTLRIYEKVAEHNRTSGWRNIGFLGDLRKKSLCPPTSLQHHDIGFDDVTMWDDKKR